MCNQREQLRGTHSGFLGDGVEGSVWARVNAMLLRVFGTPELQSEPSSDAAGAVKVASCSSGSVRFLRSSVFKIKLSVEPFCSISIKKKCKMCEFYLMGVAL